MKKIKIKEISLYRDVRQSLVNPDGSYTFIQYGIDYDFEIDYGNKKFISKVKKILKSKRNIIGFETNSKFSIKEERNISLISRKALEMYENSQINWD